MATLQVVQNRDAGLLISGALWRTTQHQSLTQYIVLDHPTIYHCSK